MMDGGGTVEGQYQKGHMSKNYEALLYTGELLRQMMIRPYWWLLKTLSPRRRKSQAGRSWWSTSEKKCITDFP